MPDKQTIAKARRDKREGKSATTQAGEFVRAQIDKIRRGLHGARSTRQAIAIGLSEARRAGVDLPPPAKGKTRRSTVSRKALSRQARSAASRRSAAQRSATARKASRTKGAPVRSAAAKKAARTRARRRR
jgi:hypothetical protein